MKKKLELKTILTIILLSIGLILMILGNKNSYCFSFGMMFFGAGCLNYAINKVKNLNKTYRELNDQFYSYKDNDILVISEYQKQIKYCKKQIFRTKVVFYGFSAIMIILGFVMLL